uniref:Uncharacterized protein n=1 Tax=Anguilla anguilla TaxID=7936 RepID=A0A0E9V3R6_ANGAN
MHLSQSADGCMVAVGHMTCLSLSADGCMVAMVAVVM